MLLCKCMIILCFWCPYRHYFVRVLLFIHYFHLCCYETYCKTYAVNEYSYSYLVLLFNSLFIISHSFVLLTEFIFFWCCSEHAFSNCSSGDFTAIFLVGCCLCIINFICAAMTHMSRFMLLINIHTFIFAVN